MDRCSKLLRENCVLLVVVAFFLARLPLLSSFMTHVDDIGPIWDVMAAEDQGLMAQIAKVRTWTYAPGHFLQLAIALRLATDHVGLLFWGRLPSLLAWLVGLVAAFRLFRACFPERPWVANLLIVIQAVSWRGLLESSQGYNYAVTSFAAALALAIFLREASLLQGPQPPDTLPRRELVRALCVGLCLGLLSWLTYQALLLAAAVFLALGLLVVAGRRWRAVPRLVVLGVAWALPVDRVFRWHLRDVADRGIAPWIPQPVAPDGLLDAPWFLLRRWFEVVENNVTFLPWGAGSAALAALVLLGTCAGARRRVEPAPTRAFTDGAILAVLCSIIAVFSAGSLLGAFPLSCTRHTYVLQVPILLGLGLGLDRAGLTRRVAVALTTVVLLIGGAAAGTLFARTRRQLDIELIEGIAAADSQVAIVSFLSGHTRDHLLLVRAHPEWRGRLFVVVGLGLPGPPPRLLVISHREPLNADELEALGEAGYGAPRSIQALAPTGYTELSGNLNGGNGAYVTLLHRR